MRIKVLDRTETVDVGCIIAFHSEYGDGLALWAGGPPEIGEEYDVEISLPTRFQWGKDLLPAAGMGFTIQQDHGCMTITVLLDSVATDGCLALRLGDSIILVDAEGACIQPGEFVSVVSPTVVLYNTNT